MVICIGGKNAIAVNSLDFVIQNLPVKAQIVATTNKNDDGINGWQPSFKFACLQKNIPLISIEDYYHVKDFFFISLEYDRIIKPGLFASDNLFNVHFSLLPAYKGMYTSILPILYGEQLTGVTLHRIDRGIDTGNIIAQKTIPIKGDMNARQVYDLYNSCAYDLVKENFQHLISNNFTEEKQSADNASYYSKKELDLSNIKIDLNKTACEIHNQIRSFAFRDYQLPVVFGSTIYKSKILDSKSINKAGTVVDQTVSSLTIDTIDYQIELFLDRQEELFHAASMGNIELIDSIEKTGYDISIRNKKGWNILIVACYNQHLDLVEYLLDKGFDVNSKNYKGTTAFMYAKSAASSSGNTRLLDLLINRNADLTLKDDAGLTALEYAEKEGSQHIIQLIKKITYK